MTAVPLRILRSRTPSPACAWLVPDGDAAGWLDEIAALGLGTDGLRLFVVPRSASDATAGALLVVPAGEHEAVCVPGRALPLARRGARLLVPADGRLWPPVEDREIDAFIPRGLHLLHPVFGSVHFDDADALRVSDLIIPLSRRDARWDAANPGIRQPVLRGVRGEPAPGAEAVLASGRGDTSSRPFDALPPGPGEARESPADRIGNWIARTLLNLTKDVPRTASAPTWIDGMERWAHRRLRQDIESLRAREIERLLHLLRTDPDVGLQFALPIADLPSRGVAPPSGRLPARPTDFDARRLRGDAPADSWNLAPEKTRDLLALYRQQAERAIRLGQHRRAAYVLANLLGDLRGAANALEQGGHWREATALYRERLKDDAAAAACLERGGLITEAIDLYLEVGNRLRAASLLDRVGRRSEAERLWRDVVAERLKIEDRVGAAALLAGELRVPDEALDALDERRWPLGGQADRRLRSALELLGRLGRGLDACRWVRRARLERCFGAPVVDVLARAAVSHPDATCRAEAADAVRVLVGSKLSEEPSGNNALLDALVATDRGDRLLRRDASRFGASRTQRPKPPARTAARWETVAEFGLPNLDPESLTVVPTRDGLLVLGTCPGGPGVELHSIGWDGRQRAARLRWDLVGSRASRGIVRVDEFSRRVLVAFPGAGPRLHRQEFSGADGRAWQVLTPPWVPNWLVGMCPGAALTTWTLVEMSEEEPFGYVATCHGQDGATLRSAAMRCDSGDDVVPIAAVGGAFVVAVPGSGTFRVDGKGVVSELGSSIAAESFVAAPAHLGATLVAVGKTACGLWTRLDRADTAFVPFAEDAESPRASFLGDGRIAVFEEGRIRLFRVEDDRVRCVLDQEGVAGRSRVAAVRGPQEREVGVVTVGESGVQMSRVRFPANR